MLLNRSTTAAMEVAPAAMAMEVATTTAFRITSINNKEQSTIIGSNKGKAKCSDK